MNWSCYLPVAKSPIRSHFTEQLATCLAHSVKHYTYFIVGCVLYTFASDFCSIISVTLCCTLLCSELQMLLLLSRNWPKLVDSVWKWDKFSHVFQGGTTTCGRGKKVRTTKVVTHPKSDSLCRNWIGGAYTEVLHTKRQGWGPALHETWLHHDNAMPHISQTVYLLCLSKTLNSYFTSHT